jgi:hypothetical protein
MWGIIAITFIILFILAILYSSISQNKTPIAKEQGTEHFIAVKDDNLFQSKNKGIEATDRKPESIKYQVPIPANQLTDVQLQGLDTDVLRQIRRLKNFSNTDELDYYQMYNILKQLKDKYTAEPIRFNYDAAAITKKSHILESEKIMELNTGAINNTDLELFSRLKLELISIINNLIIQNNYYLPYHQYQFFKIINNNLISNDTIPAPTTMANMNIDNYVFTITIGREFKYQQFVIYFDVDLILADNGKEYTARINKAELIGLPIPRTIEFHQNSKTDYLSSGNSDILGLIDDKKEKEQAKKELLDIYKDQVSDSATFDVMPIGDGKLFQSPATKFIDILERSDMEPAIFNESSQQAMVEQRIMNVARDQQFKNHRCYGLVNGISKELVEYNDNPIFCKSYHPEIGQVGIWDAPCQINTDCPFYQANKNYPNEFGKCNKMTGKCEMPMGVIPIGFKKYGKTEPNCYNCGMGGSGGTIDMANNKCCGKQAEDIAKGKVNYKSPDYVFLGDEYARKQFGDILEENGLKVLPSL